MPRHVHSYKRHAGGGFFAECRKSWTGHRTEPAVRIDDTRDAKLLAEGRLVAGKVHCPDIVWPDGILTIVLLLRLQLAHRIRQDPEIRPARAPDAPPGPNSRHFAVLRSSRTDRVYRSAATGCLPRAAGSWRFPNDCRWKFRPW